MIWFLSDTHYNHTNMCYGVSSWEKKEKSTRRFNTLEEMNDAIVKSINDCVKEDDEIYFLGDWSFGGIESIYTFWKRIICKNIHFIPGNHDNNIKKNKELPNCHYEDEYDIFVDNPPHNNSSIAGAQDLFRNILPELTTITYNKQKFVLSHYPLEQWEDMDRGSIHLHGHCHGNINNCEINTKYRRMDVGMDWKEFRPYSIEEILEIMKERKFKEHVKNI